MQEIKKLKHQISVVQADKAKLKELLDECKAYKQVRSGAHARSLPPRCCCCCDR